MSKRDRDATQEEAGPETKHARHDPPDPPDPDPNLLALLPRELHQMLWAALTFVEQRRVMATCRALAQDADLRHLAWVPPQFTEIYHGDWLAPGPHVGVKYHLESADVLRARGFFSWVGVECLTITCNRFLLDFECAISAHCVNVPDFTYAGLSFICNQGLLVRVANVFRTRLGSRTLRYDHFAMPLSILDVPHTNAACAWEWLKQAAEALHAETQAAQTI